MIRILLDIGTAEVCWPRVMALCLYSQFLLVSHSGNCDSKIPHILDQVKNGCNPFPLILAETLICLDNFASLGRLTSSPMLLEVSPPPPSLFCASCPLHRLLTTPFSCFCRCGSMRSWACWLLLKIFHAIGLRTAGLGHYSPYQKTSMVGYQRSQRHRFAGLIPGGDYST